MLREKVILLHKLIQTGRLNKKLFQKEHTMQAIREIKKIKDKKIVVNLPENFQAKEVEVIIPPVVHKKGKKQSPKVSDLLLKVPLLSQREIENIKGIQGWFDKWKVSQF